jgi:antitoxin CptB
MNAIPPSNTARLRWQCRRGMRELDLLLIRYLEGEYPTTSSADQRAFERLLELTDPELLSYLLHGERPADQELAHVIERVRNLRS